MRTKRRLASEFCSPKDFAGVTFGKAVENYRRSLEKHPDCRFNSAAAFWAGKLCWGKLKDYEQAVYFFEKQRADHPEDPFAKMSLYWIGLCYQEYLGDYAKGVPYFEEYLAECPGAPNMWAAYNGLADCHVKLGNNEQALAVLQEAYEKSAGNQQLRKDYGRQIKQLQKGDAE